MNVKMNSGRIREMDRVGANAEEYRLAGIKSWHFSEWNLITNDICLTLFLGGGIFYSIHLWNQGDISLGSIIMTLLLFTNFLHSFRFLGKDINRFFQNLGEVKEGTDFIFTAHEIEDPQSPQKTECKKGAIEFKNLFFQYESEDKYSEIFNNFSLSIEAGEKVGLVGESGAGKSTLVSLLLRFMDVSDGSVLIDGQDIRDIQQDKLRKNITYVPQEPLLFHRSLHENISYSNPTASDSEISNAAKKAHANEFIDRLPEKYKTLVGERGVKLSGGQKQRVAIARALLKDAPIVILDEATSALDSTSEKLIQKAFEEVMKDKTTIVIAHRLSTLRQMDRIVVLDKGNIAEEGTHEQLLKKKGKYAELWDHQVGGFITE